MENRKHFAIIGGGLAGTFLAYRLLCFGQVVTVFDTQTPGAASRVAAGMFNVITGRFGAKSWMADELLPELKSFIALPEFRHLAQHVHFTPIYRPFRDAGEYNKWLGRSADPAFSKWVAFESQPQFPDRIDNPWGGIMIKPCGWVDISAWINGIREWCRQHDDFRFVDAYVDYPHTDLEKRQLRIPGETMAFDEIIFCQGYHTAQNPFFPAVPVIPNKGEILILESEPLALPFVLSKGVYVIPIGGNRYVAGSTYRNQFEDPQPSEAGRQQIEEKLHQAIRVPWKVIEQRAGIRPTTRDRRPIVGTHPRWNHVHICTGFGTKGVLLAPYISRLMANYLLDKTVSLPDTIDLGRFSDANVANV